MLCCGRKTAFGCPSSSGPNASTPRRLMPFDPERWLEAAAVCCIEIPEVDREALLRTALNRAYYAALLSFKHRIELVQGAGAVPERRTHEAIYHAVGAAGHAFM